MSSSPDARDHEPDAGRDGRPRPDRRVVLTAGGLAASLAVAGGALWAVRDRPGGPPERPVARPDGRRVLVVVEMAGGNDGLNTVVPFTDAAYPRLRRHTGVDPGAVHRLDAAFGLHPALGRLHARGVAAVVGVGVARPDLSHFEMLRRWWQADPDGRGDTGTGVLGRICDALGDPGDPAVGISVATAPSPALAARRVVTLSLDPQADPAVPAPDDPDLRRAWLAAVRAMAHPDRAEAASLLPTARRQAGRALRIGEVARRLPAAGSGYPDGDLAAQLRLAARLIAADEGVRVLHVPYGADFDTHTDHLARHEALMAGLDAALDAFLADLARRGLAERVLVATTSEFGRRAADNDSSGLDHGTASAALLAGPVVAGVHGEPPRLDRLDGDGNLRATVPMNDYWALLAEGWLGVPAGEVLPGTARPVPGVLR